jgi:hypothetical protein
MLRAIKRRTKILTLSMLGIFISSAGLAAPAQATFSDNLYDHNGNYAGYWVWNSVENAAKLYNYPGGANQIRLYVDISVGGTYYSYKDAFIPDGYTGSFKFYLPSNAETVRMKACYYRAGGVFTGRCQTRYDTNP